MSAETGNGHMHVVPISVDYTASGTEYGVAVQRCGDITSEQGREMLAAAYGLEVEQVHRVAPPDRAQTEGTRTSRTFGFSNWSGSTWEPTGPKGNPSLN